VATNLALSIEGPVQLLDCDVEEPNAHLFVSPSFDTVETVFTPVPEVDQSKCTLCGQCNQICQFKAIVVIGETVLSFPELCHSCGGCVAVCPEEAITETTRELGVIRVGHRDCLEFVDGELRVGEAMSPPLIRKVRARERYDGVTIIDAPPGTSCPVIACIKDTDFVLMVTEPTPFGLHDLKLAVGAARLLGIPTGLVINRCDVGNDEVKQYAKREGIPILMEIPFDRAIAESYSKGQLLVDVMPEWKTRFSTLYAAIQEAASTEGSSK